MSQDRRTFIKTLGAPLLATSGILNILGSTPARAQFNNPPPPVPVLKTTVSIQGNQFFINGSPTYQGRVYQGHKIEGLLFESRMVNAIIDDQNETTRGLLTYPDGSLWDPERNTNEFIANLPHYRACGLTSVAFNIQGGNLEGYLWHQPWHTSGYSPGGALRPDYRARLARVIEAADAVGMVVILGLFYISATPALEDERAVIRAADAVTEFLCSNGYTNVIVEIANEVFIPRWKYDILKPPRAHELIERIQKNSAGKLKTPAGRLLVTTNGALPPDSMFAVADYITLHGNSDKTPNALRAQVQEVRTSPTYKGQPILFTEDDHFDFDKSDSDFMAAVEEYAGWGYFDYRGTRERFADGYQSLPVDWGINSVRKKSFFTKLAEVTGGQPPS